MSLKLKQFRIKAGLTQAKLAKAVGVSQPNYQRWESGTAPIPEDKLKKLAEVLQAGADTLLGRHAPIHAGFYDESIGEDLNYYGEVSIHFHGGGKPLLLSITDGEFSRLYRNLQRNLRFVIVESLANQKAIIRTQAIADLYFSSEAYDDFGLEHEDYEDHILFQMPDPRDWEIVEALSEDDEYALSEFSTEDVQRVSEVVMITDEQYEVLVADGRIRPEDLERERNKNQEETDRIFGLATKLKYQLSNGRQRSVESLGAEEMFEAFYKLVDFDGDTDDDLIAMSIEGTHRIAFINKAALDYVILPAHRFDQGRIEVEGKMLDEN
ncbi:helix-turn-helix domain-containing protein [Pseudomonas schmalbachii]|uniref:Helix-turn-helix transcriptional regulator n=1 Tax=Pseudomonas schmalbachii TaxID=2816993 RepID=A0ABS3TWM1_9PSED|nr:helix-turn-helix transcriptional regulator [Pseudomonas schmalbachii]MBO3277035.1 helix-turn-helix transcriptional regulator [Pseudomonas schmalbachii]